MLLKSTPRAVATKLAHELEVSRSLVASEALRDGVLKAVELLDTGGASTLVLEDPGGEPLDRVLRGGHLALENSLILTIDMAGILAALHRRGFIHRDVRPCHILADLAAGRARLTGLGHCSAIPRERQADVGVLRDAPAYMSPEQTGRTNRLADYRTDFYSLGVTLYEMLTGRLPFVAEDALGWVHAHLAKQPPAPSDIVPELPVAVSELVLKLLAKTAEDRYQGGDGLRHDLERCLSDLRSRGTIRRFTLGERDLAARFELSQLLYGRKDEVRRLTETLEAARHGPRVLLVAGPSGVGKTRLIEELRHRVLVAGGLFVNGKYQEMGREEPMHGILEALRRLVRRFLGASRDVVAAYRRALSQALGANLGVVAEAVPELTALVGELEPPPSLEPAGARRRFLRSISRFLRVFATEDPPLVLVLDDLQWIDRSSLELLAAIVDSGSQNLLLLGAYRDDEVEDGHPLTPFLDQLRRRGVPVESLPLAPLNPLAIRRLVADSLRTTPAEARPLAELVFRRGGGRPLFTRTFLASLHESGLLSLDADGTGWRWDLRRIAELETPETVGRLAAQWISRLPEEPRRLAALAAALGGRFEVDELAAVSGMPMTMTSECVLAACRERILVSHGDSYEFAHDGLRESAYALIPSAARAATLPSIGRRLIRQRNGESFGPRVFDVVRHFNRALDLLEAPADREQTARLNLAAGRRARRGSAFPAALEYFTIGLKVLGPKAWQDHYRLALALHNETAELAVVNGEFEEASRLARLVHHHATALLDEVPAFETRFAIAVTKLRQDEALTTLLEVLRCLEVEIPLEPSIEEVEIAVAEADRTLDSLLAKAPRDRPPMTDPALLAAMRLLMKLATAATWTNQLLNWMANCKALELTLSHGYSPEAPLNFVVLAMMRSQLLDDPDGGQRAANLGLALLDQPGSEQWQNLARITFLTGTESWSCHPNALLPVFSELYHCALETGDLMSATLAALDHCVVAFHSGMELQTLVRLIRSYNEDLEKAGLDRVAVPLEKLRNLALTLRGNPPDGDDPRMLSGEAAESKARLEYPGGHAGHHFGITYCHDILVHHLFRHSRAAFGVAVAAAALPESAIAGLIFSDFYLCLALLDPHRGPDPGIRRHHLAVVDSRLRRMRHRARDAPMNYEHKIDLIEAERQRVLGRPLEAMAFYDRAADRARRNRYVQDEALALELAAELRLELDQRRGAALYLAAAAAAYERWGARGKLEDLAARHPDLVSLPAASTSPAPPEPRRADALDLASLERATQTLSRELDLDQLLRELIEILLENAAAQRGFLLRDDGGEIVIEASGSIDEDEVRVLRHQALESRRDLARSVVRYVSRSRETVVLDDAAGDERFAADPYIAQRHPSSILCLPILHQGRSVALVYLENNRIRDAFVADRLAAVQLIASQAAVALENARLHDALRLRNQELEAQNAQLERFTYTVSHDLKTPLVTIQGFVGLLGKDLAEGSSRAEHDLDKIRAAASRMAGLLDDLLELSRIGRVVGTPEEVALGELAREAVDLLAERIAERGIEVTVAEDLPVVSADRLRLQEVFQNLVENAVKFTGDQERPRIEIGVRRDDGDSVYFVRDNGLGIAAPYREKVFGLFERLDAAAEGTGIGLAVVKRIVEIHGGRIWAESEGLGHGTSFCFTLPSGRPP